MALNVDKHSEAWRAVEAYVSERLKTMRRRLELQGLDLIETEGIRHSIIELEALLKFPNPSKMVTGSLEP